MAASSSIHSNAFNFMSFLQSGVDPRTGLYTVSISMPELKTDDLAGPVIPLALTFSPLNTLDTGFGLGWNLQLSQYTPHDQILSLSTGETFKVTGTSSVDNQLLMKEKKLDSFHFHDLGGGRYKVVHKSGLVEILQLGGSSTNRIALPHEIHSPDGRKVRLSYDYFGDHQMLVSVSDAQRRLLTITRSARSVVVRLHPDVPVPPDELSVLFTLSLVEDDYKVGQITLPTAENACWRFDYIPLNGLTCIKQVWNPVGGRETVAYNDAGHAFPGLDARPALRRVTDHTTYPGAGQPTIEARYTYRGNGTDNSKNFLGYNASGLIWEDNGLDNLYKITGAYVYGTTESLYVAGLAVRTVERSFNRFHLLTEETTTQNKNVKRVVTVYYANDGVDFANQPVYCQLPKTVTNSWSSLDNPNLVRRETVSSEYDLYGNLTQEVQANGITETNRYYPAAGEPGLCPVDPEGFVRQLKTQTVTPAPADVDSPAPTLCTRYRYQAMASVTGGVNSWLVIKDETLQQIEDSGEQLMQTTAYSYFDVPGDALRHGRQRKVTLTLHNALTYAEHSTSTDFVYEKTAGKAGTGRASETVLKTTQTLSSSFDSVHKVITLEHSLLNGEPLLNRDDSDVEIRYTYDALGRVVNETVAPDTDFIATRHYAYVLVGLGGQTASQTVTDVKGVQTCSHLDGLNRVIKEERQDTDNPTSAGAFRQTYSAEYDARGQLLAETDYDWLGDQDLPLKRAFGYDDWGQQDSETAPERVVTFSETDLIGGTSGPIQRKWTQVSLSSTEKYNLTVTQLNLFEKPDSVERFTRDGQSIGKQLYRYDGLGRTAEEIDALGHSTQYRYDAFDRMVENTLPDNTVVRREYALHSAGDLPTLISADDRVLGEQSFDGLDRMYHSVTGGRAQVFTFEPGQTQPSTVTTASKQVIEYTYLPMLGEEPLMRRIPASDTTADYTYDPLNARLLHCKELGQQLTREYYSTGELKSEVCTQGVDTYGMQYSYSLSGRLLAYTDVLGQTQLYEYDAAGRLNKTMLGQTVSTFGYNALGQTQRITTVDGAQSVTITLEYDDQGREVMRTFNFGGVVQTLTQSYNSVDELETRVLKEGTAVLRDETFGYDTRGRLVNYTCEGSQPPVDPYGKAILSQSFRFDALDNLTLLLTTFQGGSNRATHTYDETDPTQLVKVVNSHDDYTPKTIELNYDADGNLIADEQGRTLSYDALGRLTEVSGPSTHSEYHYDPLDKLSSHTRDTGQDQRFYRDGELANQLRGEQHSTFIRGGDYLLAEQQGEGS